MISQIAIGIGTSLAAALIIVIVSGPILEILASFHLIKLLSKLLFSYGRHLLGSSHWTQDWSVQSDQFPSSNASDLIIYNFFGLIATEHTAKTISGEQLKVRTVAKKWNGRITGRWYDPHGEGYYGVFQLLVSPAKDHAIGKWCGFSFHGTVKCDHWIWTKAPVRSANQ